MSGLEKALFNLKFTEKQLTRQAAKAKQEAAKDEAKLEKAMKQGNQDIAKVYAQNVIRKQNEHLNLLRLASRIDGVASRISMVMDKFESQFEDLDVATSYYENATTSANAINTPQEDVDRLLGKVADKVGVELDQELNAATPARGIQQPTEVEEEGLGERLRALRN
ncbi:Vacuolar-sorting protein SNF7 [Orbilia oligospora]|uniref:Vacuolar-sorting protein SNF7 n=1 Tax=Orbilia oligospora TaxID=2813651 RepID=A0A7C8JVT7_ORBOL|nr:Vacuolar-sorting protein SNF7 [Orbilia oligospora]